MLAVFVWIMAGTAMWHFSVLVPDRFYRGIMGSLVAANAGALLAGFAASGFVAPETTSVVDAMIGLAGGLAALVVSWLVGNRYDPVHLHEPEKQLEARKPRAAQAAMTSIGVDG